MKMRSFIFTLFFIVIMAEGARVLHEDSIDISVTDTYTTSVKKRVGLSTLNIGDSDKRRSEGFVPFQAAMKDMKPGVLRFPGGIEASSYLWATAPSWEPSSHAPAFNITSRWPNSDKSIVKDGKFVDAVNFDEFMAMSNAVGAEVTVVINFESMYTEDGPSKELLIETAVRWVRYCKTKGYTNVRYWEIGNETDMISSYNGMMANASVYGNDAKDFIIAMKREDPSILVGINGFHEDFIKSSFDIVGEYIDFFVIHPYPFYGFTNGYTNFTEDDGSYGAKYDKVLEALDSSVISNDRKDAIFLMATETGVIDWKHIETGVGWGGNDVGHALGMFEMLGKFMSYDRIRGILPWTSHWVNKTTTNKTEIYNMLDEKNHFNPIAYGMLPWTHAGDGRMLQVEYLSSNISVYALNNGTNTMVMMLNKMSYPVSINLNFDKKVLYAYSYRGETAESKTIIVENMDPKIPQVLKKFSITVVSFVN
ncbi:hypothetical protein ATCVTN60342_994L [Acanthocystis turfacea Chlorella virus TN603.4.2]|nr:hypothetical protein ATCVTN60342_994L [Acanthocystis turfacea Chlorella virus TN603.4.2]